MFVNGILFGVMTPLCAISATWYHFRTLNPNKAPNNIKRSRTAITFYSEVHEAQINITGKLHQTWKTQKVHCNDDIFPSIYN